MFLLLSKMPRFTIILKIPPKQLPPMNEEKQQLKRHQKTIRYGR
jgi:hypothetical protein